jgi:hypothetical protein
MTCAEVRMEGEWDAIHDNDIAEPTWKSLFPFPVSFLISSLPSLTVLLVLLGQQYKLLKVNMFIIVGIKLDHGILNRGRMNFFAYNLKQRTQLGSTDRTIPITIKDLETLLERGNLFRGEIGSGGGLGFLLNKERQKQVRG